VAENEPQHAKLIRPPAQGGYGLDALWNDDFHHSAMVALTGRHEAYYTDYGGTPQEFISACKWGYLYQGQRYTWQQQRRGTPAFGLPPATFVTFFQNHDQIANSGRGLRCHLLTSPGRYKALTAVLLLGPGTPMLFQGQEFAASSPFLYFADFPEALARLVRQGRVEFLKQFRSLDNPAMHRDLLRLRRQDPVLCTAQCPGGIDGAVLGPEAFVLRFFSVHGNDRLLIVNLGRDLHLAPAPEPLLAPPEERAWQTLWSSEDPCYGGGGTTPLDTEHHWQIPGHAAVVLWPMPVEEAQDA
jgi:maltooligosyltrehalose trehalohydrolase